MITALDFYNASPATIECTLQAAQIQGVPANVLLALSSREGGRNGQQVANTNGSKDLGHWQINTSQLKPGGLLASLKGKGVTVEDVASRGCYNALLAAYILRQCLDEPTGQDYWTRVANFHSHTPRYNAPYRAAVMELSKRWAVWLQMHYQIQVSYG